jgi:hypothetical protein
MTPAAAISRPSTRLITRLAAVPDGVWFALCLAIVALRGVSLSYFGLELMDTGWHLHLYQQIFTTPESVQYQFVYWFDGIIGGVWHYFFPGLFPIRILGVIIQLLTLTAAYYLLKNTFHSKAVLAGLLMVALCHATLMTHFHYNPLSVFLFLVAVVFLKKGILNDSPAWLIGGAFVLVLNVFARLPNLPALALVALVPLFAFLKYNPFSENTLDKRNAWKKILFLTAKQSAFFVLGCIAALAAVFSAMKLLNHWELFLGALETMREIPAAKSSTHGNMSREYILSFIQAFNTGIVLLFLLAVAVLFCNAAARLRLVWQFVTAAFIFALAALAINFDFWGSRMLWFYFFAIAAAAVFLIKQLPRLRGTDSADKPDDDARLFALLSGLLLLFYFPAGTDIGIFSAGTPATWLAFPAACGLFPSFFSGGLRLSLQNKSGMFSANIRPSAITTVLLVFASAFWVVEIKKSMSTGYNDPGYLIHKRTAINSPLAKNVYSTERLAKNLNELLSQLKQHAAPGTHLLCYDSLSLVNYLTETQSFTENSWIWVFPSNVLEKKIKKREVIVEKQPPIVIQKIQRKRPSAESLEPVANYLSDDNRHDPYSAKRAAVIKSYMSRHNYRLSWNNEYFEIWLPANK